MSGGILHQGRDPIVTEYAFPLLTPADDLVRFWDLAGEHVSVVRRGGFYTEVKAWPGTDPARPWAVTFRTRCWDRAEGGWVYEPSPSSRNAAFFRRCRFNLDDALTQVMTVASSHLLNAWGPRAGRGVPDGDRRAARRILVRSRGRLARRRRSGRAGRRGLRPPVPRHRPPNCSTSPCRCGANGPPDCPSTARCSRCARSRKHDGKPRNGIRA